MLFRREKVNKKFVVIVQIKQDYSLKLDIIFGEGNQYKDACYMQVLVLNMLENCEVGKEIRKM